MNLLDKKVLFIGPEFNNYENKIIEIIQHNGGRADYVPLMHFDTTLYRLLNHIKYFKKILENRLVYSSYKKLNTQNYDYVFIIRGGTLCSETINRIRNANTNAKFILYLWDSIIENPYVKNILKDFDTIKSFDPNDCKNYNFEFVPLFYTNDFIHTISSQKIYDISFVGINHSDRYNILKSIGEYASKRNYTTNFIIVTSKLAYLKKKIFDFKNYKSAKRTDFRFSKISLREVSDIYSCSECVIDIHNTVQSGLTMRVFELLATGNKLITTNAHIKDFDFYNSKIISVIDRKNPIIEDEFLSSKDKICIDIKDYSIDAWIKKIFS